MHGKKYFWRYYASSNQTSLNIIIYYLHVAESFLMFSRHFYMLHCIPRAGFLSVLPEPSSSVYIRPSHPPVHHSSLTLPDVTKTTVAGEGVTWDANMSQWTRQICRKCGLNSWFFYLSLLLSFFIGKGGDLSNHIFSIILWRVRYVSVRTCMFPGMHACTWGVPIGQTTTDKRFSGFDHVTWCCGSRRAIAQTSQAVVSSILQTCISSTVSATHSVSRMFDSRGHIFRVVRAAAEEEEEEERWFLSCELLEIGQV